MENNTFKSVAFGGFDKQDVIRYIEKTSKEASAEQERLQQENERCKLELESVGREANTLRGQLAEENAAVRALREENARLAAALEEALACGKDAQALRVKAEALEKEVEKLRPDAQAYAQFREKIGAIECEARKRAADLEEATRAKLQKVTEDFREQYGQLMTTFQSTSAYVNSELRKVEVNLTQLPRALDKNGAELKELAAVLEKSGKGE